MLKILDLVRPIAFIDIETTGLNPIIDRIIEISVLKINVNGHKESYYKRLNPEISISFSSTGIHGITNAEVENEPTFKQCAKSLRDFLDDCDISGFGVISFDLPCLEAEFIRANIKFSRKGRYIVDSQVIFH
jgi:DNA polymerase III subunit epsilon